MRHGTTGSHILTSPTGRGERMHGNKLGKKYTTMGAAILMAVSAVGLTAHAADVQFTGTNSNSWHDGGNWFNNAVPDNNNNYFVQHDLTAVYSTGTSSVQRLYVSDDSAGSLSITGGHLTVTAGGDSFGI